MLATVAEAPEQRLKMGDLAEALVITRGGLTKLVDRLIKAGLLERTFCETDRRVSYATLMPAGSDMLDEMRPVVIAELEVAFAAKLSVAEADEPARDARARPRLSLHRDCQAEAARARALWRPRSGPAARSRGPRGSAPPGRGRR